MRVPKIPFWAWFPPYILGTIISWLNHNAARVTIICWGLCVIILIWYFNHSYKVKDAKCVKMESEEELC